MAGIYLHIPFCKSRCTYCDFYMGTNESHIDAFVEALSMEATLRRGETRDPIGTIYFGGGTPSRLQRHHFERIFDTLYGHYLIEADAEITVEANPDDLTEEYVAMLASLPFNRLSIGIQSFDDKELHALSRRHTAREAIDAVKRCQQQGFHNISVDLIYGLPGQTIAVWQRNLALALALEIQHISSYHLIYEERTRMYRLLQSGRITPVPEETSTNMFAMLIDQLTVAGFIHYEISAFAKEGFFSRHNSSYWKDVPYIGLGPSAHSYDGTNRSWNVRSILRYNKGAKNGQFEREKEQLSPQERYNEFILTGLRTIWGIDLRELEKRFGKEFLDYCRRNAQPFLERGVIRQEGSKLTLTREGIFISDGIMSDLMRVN
ncbi:MAG: radical SAM family heme chaperone HemW [bacterium]|nr:radical SAM family heme chaperone HemW [bacterium]MDD3624102.1 radical SAM family heme chaperone HemW [Proteiniphilum sp.]MDD3967716.1 radical SAM family heme chaperone HemW [Proteiniphilum sp.]MDD4458939.1 radical SAM family heme chaperone HemW [Proteiniphilum sp.]